MEQPSIYPFTIRIDEPVTTLTDVMVAAVCFYAFSKLGGLKVDHRIYRLTRGYFLCMGIATFIGGVVGHGFLYALSPAWKFPGWAFSMVAINLIERVMINYTKPFMSPRLATFFSWFNVFELIVFAGLAYGNLLFEFIDIDSFRFVEIHSAYGLMVFVFGFSLYNYRKRDRNRDILYFIWAVAAAACASFFFMTGIGISKWYNHIDISHTFMMVSAFLFYRGSAKMLEHIANRINRSSSRPADTELVAE